MARRVLKYQEVLDRLKNGEGIRWQGGADFTANFNWGETVRIDTLIKLYKQGLITHWGFPELYGTIKHKGVVNSRATSPPATVSEGLPGSAEE